MSELPSGWERAVLGDIAEIAGGVGFPLQYQGVESGDFGFFKVGDISRAVVQQKGELRDARHYVTCEVARTLKGKPIRSGATVFAKIGEAIRLNRRAYVVEDCLVDNNVMAVTALGTINNRYLFMFLRTVDLSELARATTVPSLRKTDIESLEVPLAPLGEQKRIADKLDALLTRLDACRERLDRVPAILKRFRRAVLAAAANGELTREWREAHPPIVDASELARLVALAHSAAGGHRAGNAAPPTDGVHDLSVDMFPRGWSLVTLRELVQPERPITYGILKPGPELEAGVPYIRVADFPNERLNFGTIRKTSPAIDAEFKRSRLQRGDLLLSIRGTVGRLVVVPAELEKANITQDTARLSVQPTVNPTFVLWMLRSDPVQRRMRAAVKGVAVRGINIGDVRALQIPLPSRPEQDEIVRRVEELLGYCDHLVEQTRQARARIDRLTPSILAKAFRGGIVAQDPSDEPASVLLARLRFERETAPVPRRGRALTRA